MCYRDVLSKLFKTRELTTNYVPREGLEYTPIMEMIRNALEREALVSLRSSVVAVLCHYGSGLAGINGNNKEPGQGELNTRDKMDVISWWGSKAIMAQRALSFYNLWQWRIEHGVPEGGIDG